MRGLLVMMPRGADSLRQVGLGDVERLRQFLRDLGPSRRISLSSFDFSLSSPERNPLEMFCPYWMSAARRPISLSSAAMAFSSLLICSIRDFPPDSAAFR